MSHIALLLPEMEAGGAQRVMLHLAREFTARGHRVDLVLLQATGQLLEEIPNGVKLVDLAAREYGFGQLGFTFSSVLRLTSWLKQEQPAFLLSTINGANLVALLSRKMIHAQLKVIIREAVTLKNIKNTLRLKAMRWLYPQADTVIALSKVMADELATQIGVSTSRIHCIPNPVDAAFIYGQAQIHLEHPWLDDEHLRVIVSVGRLIPQKDYATLLRAFALLPRALSAHLIIVGEGPERIILEQLAEELGIADRMQLVGFDINPWRWMARADLFVLSSQWEGYPNALLEALVLKLPTITTEYDMSVNNIASRYHFTVVPVSDPAALALAQELLLRKSETRKQSSPTDDAANIVEKYLGALGCSVSALGRTPLDHKTAS